MTFGVWCARNLPSGRSGAKKGPKTGSGSPIWDPKQAK